MLDASGGLWSKLLLKAGSTKNSDEVSQGLIQLSLDSLQGWRLHSLSGKPVLLIHCSSGKSFPLNLAPVSLVSIYTHCLLSFCHVPLCRAWFCFLESILLDTGLCSKVSLEDILSKAEQAWIFQTLLRG